MSMSDSMGAAIPVMWKSPLLVQPDPPVSAIGVEPMEGPAAAYRERRQSKAARSLGLKERQKFVMKLLAEDPLHGTSHYQAICRNQFDKKGVPEKWMQEQLELARDAAGKPRRMRLLSEDRKDPEQRPLVDTQLPPTGTLVSMIEASVKAALDKSRLEPAKPIEPARPIEPAKPPEPLPVPKPFVPAPDRAGWLPVPEAAEATKIPARTIYRWIKENGLPSATGVGNKIMVELAAVLNLGKARGHDPEPKPNAKLGTLIASVISMLEPLEKEMQGRVINAVASALGHE